MFFLAFKKKLLSFDTIDWKNQKSKLQLIPCKCFIDYEYDFYGYSDYRGAGYNDSYYEDFYRTYDGEYYFDYPPGGVAPLPPPVGSGASAGGLTRSARNNVVGF